MISATAAQDLHAEHAQKINKALLDVFISLGGSDKKPVREINIINKALHQPEFAHLDQRILQRFLTFHPDLKHKPEEGCVNYYLKASEAAPSEDGIVAERPMVAPTKTAVHNENSDQTRKQLVLNALRTTDQWLSSGEIAELIKKQTGTKIPVMNLGHLCGHMSEENPPLLDRKYKHGQQGTRLFRRRDAPSVTPATTTTPQHETVRKAAEEKPTQPTQAVAREVTTAITPLVPRKRVVYHKPEAMVPTVPGNVLGAAIESLGHTPGEVADRVSLVKDLFRVLQEVTDEDERDQIFRIAKLRHLARTIEEVFAILKPIPDEELENLLKAVKRSLFPKPPGF